MTPWRPMALTLYVRDRPAAVRFYEAALGFRWNPDIWSFEFGTYPNDDFFLISVLDPTDDDTHGPGGGHLGYLVEDLEAAHARALEAGATEWYPPHDNPGAPRSSGIHDPDGNRVELWQA